MVKITKTAVPKFSKVGKKNNDSQRGSSVKDAPLIKKTTKTVKSKKIVEKDIEKAIKPTSLNEIKENVEVIKKSQKKLVDGKTKVVANKPAKNGKESTKKVTPSLKKAPEQKLVTTTEKKNETAKKPARPRVSKSEVKTATLPKANIKRKKTASTDEPVVKKLKGEESLDEEKKPENATKSKRAKKNAALDVIAEVPKFTPKIKDIEDLVVEEEYVRKCVKGILTLAKKNADGKKTLLPDDNSPILLQVNCVKIPKVARRQIRIYLPHMMVGPTDEVALFVPDLERGRRKDYEKTVEHWETILREHNVTRIKEIIPMNKVKTEYGQYEMKLKLARMFDFFLVDGRITGHMTHLLGKTFKKGARPPTPVKLQRDNLKSEIENALHKTVMEIHGLGNCHTMQVASTAMPEDEIVENVMKACDALNSLYPGGWDNVRSVLIKTKTSIAIPVYFNKGNPNGAPIPDIPPLRPKAYGTAIGELSTVPGDVFVQVTPEGSVHVTKMPKTEKILAQDSEDSESSS